jgi:hypothetical protein
VAFQGIVPNMKRKHISTDRDASNRAKNNEAGARQKSEDEGVGVGASCSDEEEEEEDFSGSFVPRHPSRLRREEKKKKNKRQKVKVPVMRKQQKVEDFMDEYDDVAGAGSARSGIRKDVKFASQQELLSAYPKQINPRRDDLLGLGGNGDGATLMSMPQELVEIAITGPISLGQRLLQRMLDHTSSRHHQRRHRKRAASSQSQSQSLPAVISVPPLKSDHYGIGYEPFANAPEFRRAFEKRQAHRQRQQHLDDAQRKKNAYHTNDLMEHDCLDDDGENEKTAASNSHRHGQSAINDIDDDYFRPTRDVSGFALDDGDDTNLYERGGAAMDGMVPPHLLKGGTSKHNNQDDEYQNEIIEILSSSEDDDEDQKPAAATASSFAANLESWATAGGAAKGETARPPSMSRASTLNVNGASTRSGFDVTVLDGFVHGGSVSQTRFPGPMVPSSFRDGPFSNEFLLQQMEDELDQLEQHYHSAYAHALPSVSVVAPKASASIAPAAVVVSQQPMQKITIAASKKPVSFASAVPTTRPSASALTLTNNTNTNNAFAVVTTMMNDRFASSSSAASGTTTTPVTTQSHSTGTIDSSNNVITAAAAAPSIVGLVDAHTFVKHKQAQQDAELSAGAALPIKEEENVNVNFRQPRQTLSFQPAPLLCKRLGIPVPTRVSTTTRKGATQGKHMIGPSLCSATTDDGVGVGSSSRAALGHQKEEHFFHSTLAPIVIAAKKAAKVEGSEEHLMVTDAKQPKAAAIDYLTTSPPEGQHSKEDQDFFSMLFDKKSQGAEKIADEPEQQVLISSKPPPSPLPLDLFKSIFEADDSSSDEESNKSAVEDDDALGDKKACKIDIGVPVQLACSLSSSTCSGDANKPVQVVMEEQKKDVEEMAIVALSPVSAPETKDKHGTNEGNGANTSHKHSRRISSSKDRKQSDDSRRRSRSRDRSEHRRRKKKTKKKHKRTSSSRRRNEHESDDTSDNDDDDDAIADDSSSSSSSSRSRHYRNKRRSSKKKSSRSSSKSRHRSSSRKSDRTEKKDRGESQQHSEDHDPSFKNID